MPHLAGLEPMQRAKVLGFSTLTSSLCIYAGSTTYVAALVVADVGMALWEVWSGAQVVFWTLIALNATAFVMQTWDYVCFYFRMWPVTAVNWTAQLAALGLSSSLVGVALCADADAHGDTKVSTSIARVVAQALFTASQFSVTLAYLAHRRPDAPAAVVAPRRAASAPRGRAGALGGRA
jgi:hypothetical protein